MIVYRDFNVKINDYCAVTIGKFDGLHLGHEKILNTLCSLSGNGIKSCVILFSRTPEEYFTGKRSGKLSTIEATVKILEAHNIDICFILDFDEKICNISAEEFLSAYLHDVLHAKYIVAGEDVAFGRNAVGNAGFLRDNELKYSYKAYILEKIKYKAAYISSSLIHELIESGDIATANEMLGRSFSFSGIVSVGKKLGRQYDFPTINVEIPKELVKPRSGVYAACITIDNIKYNAVTNIGDNPTIGTDSFRSETYVFDFDEETYGKSVTVELMSFLRPEIKFASIQDLFRQISVDKENAKKLSNS